MWLMAYLNSKIQIAILFPIPILFPQLAVGIEIGIWLQAVWKVLLCAMFPFDLHPEAKSESISESGSANKPSDRWFYNGGVLTCKWVKERATLQCNGFQLLKLWDIRLLLRFFFTVSLNHFSFFSLISVEWDGGYEQQWKRGQNSRKCLEQTERVRKRLRFPHFRFHSSSYVHRKI